MSWVYFFLKGLLADGQVLGRVGNKLVGVNPDALAFSDVLTPAANNTLDIGLTGTRWRTAYLGTALDSPKWTYTGDAQVDLTGAATRTLTVRNSTASQVANVDVDGVYVWRAGHATGTFTFAGTPTAARTITWQDLSGTVALLDAAQSVSAVWTFASDPTFAKEVDHVFKVAASTTSNANGGDLSVKAGDAGAGTANGGNAILDAGAKVGGGTDGAVGIGMTNAEAVIIGRATKTTTIGGDFAVGGASNLTGALGVGGAAPASAALSVTSTTQGILFPRMTTTQRDAISSPAEGLVIYNTTTHKLNVRVAAAWEAITSA